MPTHGRELVLAARDRTRTVPAPGLVTNRADSPDHPIVALQRVIGNQGVQRLLQRAEDDTFVFPPDHISMDDSGGGYETQGPPSPDSGVDLDPSDGTLVFPPDHVPSDGGGGSTYENQGPPSPDSGVDLDPTDGTLVFPPDHIPTGGGSVGPLVNEDNIAVPAPVGPTVGDDNIAIPSFEWT